VTPVLRSTTAAAVLVLGRPCAPAAAPAPACPVSLVAPDGDGDRPAALVESLVRPLDHGRDEGGQRVAVGSTLAGSLALGLPSLWLLREDGGRWRLHGVPQSHDRNAATSVALVRSGSGSGSGSRTGVAWEGVGGEVRVWWGGDPAPSDLDEACASVRDRVRRLAEPSRSGLALDGEPLGDRAPATWEEWDCPSERSDVPPECWLEGREPGTPGVLEVPDEPVVPIHPADTARDGLGRWRVLGASQPVVQLIEDGSGWVASVFPHAERAAEGSVRWLVAGDRTGVVWVEPGPEPHTAHLMLAWAGQAAPIELDRAFAPEIEPSPIAGSPWVSVAATVAADGRLGFAWTVWHHLEHRCFYCAVVEPPVAHGEIRLGTLGGSVTRLPITDRWPHDLQPLLAPAGPTFVWRDRDEIVTWVDGGVAVREQALDEGERLVVEGDVVVVRDGGRGRAAFELRCGGETDGELASSDQTPWTAQYSGSGHH
jgi:hypothetical protein